MDENDELNQKITEMFNAWVTDINSVEIPVFVTDEQAVEIIKAGVGRPGVARKIINWIVDFGGHRR